MDTASDGAGFSREADVSGVVVQFLIKSADDDVFVEFIQNDLDAGSTSTEFLFSNDEFVCRGNGRPVTEDGWKRLRVVVGAGSRRIPAKIGGIGSKNHGLRTGFRIADDIVVESARRRVKLTLVGPGAEGADIDPGAWQLEVLEDGPTAGTRVSLPLRRKPRLLQGADNLVLGALDAPAVKTAFDEAVAAAPWRFIGAMAPGIRERWQLLLRHGDEAVTLEFRCKPLRDGLFERECRRGGDVVWRERVQPFELGSVESWSGRLPSFFVRDGIVVGELSWRVGRNGRPEPDAGRLRYPIAYPADAGLTGTGFCISAPFVSDDTRYAPARGAAANAAITTAAEHAFVAGALGRLVDRFGSRSLSLLRDPYRPDVAKEDALCAAALAAGAVAIDQDGHETSLGKSRKAVVFPISGSPGAEAVDHRLAPLAPKGSLLAAKRTPAFAVQALVRKRAELQRAAWINAGDVVDWFTAPPVRCDARAVAEAARWLSLLDALADEGAVEADTLARLKSGGRLPSRHGRWIDWSIARTWNGDLPDIPWAAEPAVVVEALNDLSIVRTGALKVSSFKVDEHLREASFEELDGTRRRRFFAWLQGNWTALSHQSRLNLAEQRVWPAHSGDLLPFGQICAPRSPRVAELLKGELALPNRSLLRFKGLGRGSRAAFRLRTRPSFEELTRWYGRRRAEIESWPIEERAPHYAALDNDIGLLLDAKDVGADIVAAASEHVTAAADGSVAPIATLHVDTEAVVRCKLLPCHMLSPGKRRIHTALGARERPSAEAVMEAARADLRLDQTFYDRLAAYHSDTGHFDSVEREPIIPMSDGVRSPGQLKLRSARILERDFWGQWREGFSPPDPSGSRSAVLIKIGVAPIDLNAKLSKAFFLWLSNQTSDIVRDHLRHVVRHWLDRRRGPSAWWNQEGSLRCLPARSAGDRFRLLSLSDLARLKSKVLLPDMPSLASQIAEHDQETWLIAVTVDGQQGSILPMLRHSPAIRSLREVAGAPIRIETSEGAADDALLARVSGLHSGKLSEELPKRLVVVDDDLDDLHKNWRSHLARVQQVKVVDRLSLVYKVRGRSYSVPAAGCFDESTNTIYVGESADVLRGLYEAVAQLIVKRPSTLSWAAILQAVEMEFKDLSLRGPRGERRFGTDDDADIRDDGGDFKDGHRLRKSKDRLPDPNDLSSGPVDPEGPKVPRGKAKPNRSTQGPSVRDTIAEAKIKTDLRERHYSHHCQACLGLYEPTRAAPPGSYVAQAAYRSSLLTSHHVQHIQSEVFLGAANILLLCNFHHAELGDALTRARVLDALGAARPVSRRFSADGKSASLIGLLANVKADIPAGEVPIFFTRQHAAAWRGSAKAMRGKVATA